MVHKEHRLFRQWLLHYEPIVGRENMYVILHDGDPEIYRLAEGCRTIYAPRRKIDWRFDRQRFELLNTYANFLLGNYECVIGGDVDELVFCDPVASGNLLDYLSAFREHPVLFTFGFHLVHHPDEPALDDDKAALGQRKFAVPDSDYCKPLVAFKEPKWSRGFHATAHQPVLPGHLYMAHLRCVDAGIANDTAEKRKETASVSENLGNIAKQRFWNAHDTIFRRLSRKVIKAEAQAFDEATPNLIRHLQSNIVANHANRGGYSMLFSENPVGVLHLPERFSDIGSGN